MVKQIFKCYHSKLLKLDIYVAYALRAKQCRYHALTCLFIYSMMLTRLHFIQYVSFSLIYHCYNPGAISKLMNFLLFATFQKSISPAYSNRRSSFEVACEIDGRNLLQTSWKINFRVIYVFRNCLHKQRWLHVLCEMCCSPTNINFLDKRLDRFYIHSNLLPN